MIAVFIAFLICFCPLFITGAATNDFSGVEQEFSFENGFDGFEQVAVLYIPEKVAELEKAPLLLHLHYLSGNRFVARNLGYYKEADKRGWYILSSELRGANTSGATSYGAVPAQHDAIGVLDFVLSKHENIDKRRIYLAGRSMGGMLALLLAGKYPDRFAGVVAGQPISDVKRWFETSALMRKPNVREVFLQEFGGTPDQSLFEYQRRSPVTYARNLAYLPVLVWAGTLDTWVPPEQPERMIEAIHRYNKYQPDVEWLVGAVHCPMNFTSGWVCDRLKYWENAPESGVFTPGRHYTSLNIITDESKSFYYFQVELADAGKFGEFQSEIANGAIAIKAVNLKQIKVDVQQAEGKRLTENAVPEIRRCRIESETVLRLEFTFGEQSAVIETKGGLSESDIPW